MNQVSFKLFLVFLEIFSSPILVIFSSTMIVLLLWSKHVDDISVNI